MIDNSLFLIIIFFQLRRPSYYMHILSRHHDSAIWKSRGKYWLQFNETDPERCHSAHILSFLWKHLTRLKMFNPRIANWKMKKRHIRSLFWMRDWMDWTSSASQRINGDFRGYPIIARWKIHSVSAFFPGIMRICRRSSNSVFNFLTSDLQNKVARLILFYLAAVRINENSPFDSSSEAFSILLSVAAIFGCYE